MTIPVDITNFSREDLMQLALAFQQRVMVQSQYIEVLQAKIEGISTENEKLRAVLADRIVGVLVHPATTSNTVEEIIQNATFVEEGEENGEEPAETPDDVVDTKDKDKFQA